MRARRWVSAAWVVVGHVLLAGVLSVEVEVGVDGRSEGPPSSSAEEAAAAAAGDVVLAFDIDMNGQRFECAVLRGEDAALAALRFALDTVQRPDLNLVHQVAAMIEARANADPVLEAAAKALQLRTAGAYLRRAAEAASDDRYLDAAADYLRAAKRPGIERDKVEQFEKDAKAMVADEATHRASLAEEARLRAIYEARVAREAAAADAARRRAAEADEDLRSMLAEEQRALEALSDGDANGDLVLTLKPNGAGDDVRVKIKKRDGEDGADGAARFCAAAAPAGAQSFLCTGETVVGMARRLGGADAAKASDGASGARFADRGDVVPALGTAVRGVLLEAEGASMEAIEAALTAARLSRRAVAELVAAHSNNNISSQVEEEEDGALSSSSSSSSSSTSFNNQTTTTMSQRERHEAAVKTLSALVRGGAPLKWAVWLARTRATLGDWQGVESTAAAALHWVAQHDRPTLRQPWGRGEPKTVALALGAAAALERGRLDKAIKFVQTGLREDPDSAPLKTQYEGLKQLQRKTEAVDKLLKKGFSLRALDALDEALGALEALSTELGALGSASKCDAYRATLLTRSCAANSRVKRHEDALLACDQALAILADAASPEQALSRAAFDLGATRAAALERDDDYDAAAREWQRLLNALGDRPTEEALAFTDDEGATHDLRRRLHMAKQLKDQWERRRDHAKVLELPANLDSLPRDRQCTWLKKQHKKLARQWHPDKARGSRNRAARKMSEVSDAKQALMQQFRC